MLDGTTVSVSYTHLIGTHARDKDAIVATRALCEAAAYYKTQGKTLWDAMIDMYEKYGYYKDDIQAITLKGIEGLQKIQEIMETLRNETPSEIAGYKVLSARDYKKDTLSLIHIYYRFNHRKCQENCVLFCTCISVILILFPGMNPDKKGRKSFVRKPQNSKKKGR